MLVLGCVNTLILSWLRFLGWVFFDGRHRERFRTLLIFFLLMFFHCWSGLSWEWTCERIKLSKICVLIISSLDCLFCEQESLSNCALVKSHEKSRREHIDIYHFFGERKNQGPFQSIYTCFGWCFFSASLSIITPEDFIKENPWLGSIHLRSVEMKLNHISWSYLFFWNHSKVRKRTAKDHIHFRLAAFTSRFQDIISTRDKVLGRYAFGILFTLITPSMW